jgi:SAM-dependent MidA family methyltransferase
LDPTGPAELYTFPLNFATDRRSAPDSSGEGAENCAIITHMTGPENADLVDVIRRLIHDRGRIPFAEFMDLALYHPQLGYYHSPREKIGPEGDFYTSPNIHPIFGHLIARQLHQMWEILGHPSPFQIVEMGAGKGLLCADILDYCREHLPEFYDDVLYTLADKSPVFEEGQRALLATFSAQGKAEWVRPGILLTGEKSITGCLLSNELIDSFPVHLVQQEGGELREIYVVDRDHSFGEMSGPPSTPELGAYLHEYGAPFQEGQRGEINLGAIQWVEGVSRSLRRGFTLTIDYGYEAKELYHPSRRQGTLLCYFRHTTSPNPYQRVGYQDITAHVNFSALIRKGETLGLQRAGYTEQYRFLTALGLLQDLEKFEARSGRYSAAEFLKKKLAMRNFLIPEGMGRLFKVLAQFKGLGEAKLIGFRDPFRPMSNFG